MRFVLLLWLAGLLRLLHLRQRNYIFYYLRTAAPDASAAPFIFTAATAGTGNSRILYYVILGLDPRISVLGNSKFIFDEIPRSSRGMTQGAGNFGRNFRRNFEQDCFGRFAPSQ